MDDVDDVEAAMLPTPEQPRVSGPPVAPPGPRVGRWPAVRQRLWALRALIAVGIAAVIVGGLGGIALAKGGAATDEGGRGGQGGPGGFQRGGPPGRLGGGQFGGGASQNQQPPGTQVPGTRTPGTRTPGTRTPGTRVPSTRVPSTSSSRRTT